LKGIVKGNYQRFHTLSQVSPGVAGYACRSSTLLKDRLHRLALCCFCPRCLSIEAEVIDSALFAEVNGSE
jgi:hypothetical protein